MEDPLAGYYLSGGFVSKPPSEPRVGGGETPSQNDPQQVPSPPSAPPSFQEYVEAKAQVDHSGNTGGGGGSFTDPLGSGWSRGSANYDSARGANFLTDLTGIGPQTTGQGISRGQQNIGWSLLSYGNFANVNTPIGSVGLLPGQGIAKAVGGALIDDEIDDIDASFDALDGNAVPGAELEADDQVTVSDEAGNVRSFGARQYNAIQDLQRDAERKANAGKAIDSKGNRVNYNVTDANRITNDDGGGFQSDSYGNAAEAEAVASDGWGSDAHFDSIDDQFDDNDSGGDSGGGGK